MGYFDESHSKAYQVLSDPVSIIERPCDLISTFDSHRTYELYMIKMGRIWCVTVAVWYSTGRLIFVPDL